MLWAFAAVERYPPQLVLLIRRTLLGRSRPERQIRLGWGLVGTLSLAFLVTEPLAYIGCKDFCILCGMVSPSSRQRRAPWFTHFPGQVAVTNNIVAVGNPGRQSGCDEGVQGTRDPVRPMAPRNRIEFGNLVNELLDSHVYWQFLLWVLPAPKLTLALVKQVVEDLGPKEYDRVYGFRFIVAKLPCCLNKLDVVWRDLQRSSKRGELFTQAHFLGDARVTKVGGLSCHFAEYVFVAFVHPLKDEEVPLELHLTLATKVLDSYNNLLRIAEGNDQQYIVSCWRNWFALFAGLKTEGLVILLQPFKVSLERHFLEWEPGFDIADDAVSVRHQNGKVGRLSVSLVSFRRNQPRKAIKVEDFIPDGSDLGVEEFPAGDQVDSLIVELEVIKELIDAL